MALVAKGVCQSSQVKTQLSLEEEREGDSNREKRDVQEMVPKSCSFFAYLTTILLVFGSYYLAKHFHSLLPPPITKSSPNVFVSSRARASLDKLANFGPRPTGSYSNEVAAVQLILGIVNNTKTFAVNKNIDIQFEVQKVSGSFQLVKFLDGFVQSYDGVQNVVVRVSAKDGRQDKSAILVNAHFDSVPQGPGASDDAISCAIMLEVIRVIANSPDIILNNDVIFLMNGAEETILAASHGFITQHRWSKDIIAFINLEAAGSGGKELLFQSGPGHSWLLQAYIDAAPHPFASVLGQEVFQSGLIPSDTDFRIFRDYGHLPGLDVAFIQNGYVYHTDHDTSARIPDGSIQRAGDNVLAVLTNLAGNKNIGADGSSNQTSVFFDLLGLCMVEYPAWVGVCLNVLLAVLGFGAVVVDVELCGKKMDVRRGECFKAILVCVLSDVLVIVVSVACSTMTGFVLGVSGFSMSWFYRTSLLFFLYSVPTLAVTFAILSKVKSYLLNHGNWGGFIEIFYFDSIIIVFGVISLLLTVFGIHSAFIFSLSLGLNLVWWATVRLLSTKLNPNTWSSFMFYIIIQLFPLTIWSYIIQIVFTVFLPIMGRRGSQKNPDIMMGLMTSFLLIILIQFILPIIISLKKQVWMTASLILIFIITILLVVFTSLGFPYSGDPVHPSQQRINILHTKRSFYNSDGSINSSDSGYLTIRADYHWAFSLLKAVPEYQNCHQVSDLDCDERLGCGFPQNRFKLRGAKTNLWVEAPQPNLKHLTPVSLQLISVNRLADHPDLHNVTIQVSGPSRVLLLMSPFKGVNIQSWSFTEEISDGAVWKDGRFSYYIQFIQGLNPRVRSFWMLVSGWSEGQPLMEVSLAGHYDHGQGKIGPGESDFVDQHPSWTSTSAWTVDYKYYLVNP